MENQLLGSGKSDFIQRVFIICRNAVWQSCKYKAFMVLEALGGWEAQQTDLSEVEVTSQTSGVSMFRICRLTSFFQSICKIKTQIWFLYPAFGILFWVCCLVVFLGFFFSSALAGPAANYFSPWCIVDPSYKLRLTIKPRKEWLHSKCDQKAFLATVSKIYRSLRKIILKWSDKRDAILATLHQNGVTLAETGGEKWPNFKHRLRNCLPDMS